jgi:hypothetical protein
LETPEAHDDWVDLADVLDLGAAVEQVLTTPANQMKHRVSTLDACVRGVLISTATRVESAGSCGRSQQKKPLR